MLSALFIWGYDQSSRPEFFKHWRGRHWSNIHIDQSKDNSMFHFPNPRYLALIPFIKYIAFGTMVYRLGFSQYSLFGLGGVWILLWTKKSIIQSCAGDRAVYVMNWQSVMKWCIILGSFRWWSERRLILYCEKCDDFSNFDEKDRFSDLSADSEAKKIHNNQDTSWCYYVKGRKNKLESN